MGLYQPERLSKLPTLSQQELQTLYNLSKRYTLEKFLSNHRNVKSLGLDFIYQSAQLEGNSYTQLETQELVELGYTAGGKSVSDAIMILNLRKCYDIVLDKDLKVTLNIISDLHSKLAKDLVDDKDLGIPRDSSVRIAGTDYVPAVGQQYLHKEMKFLLSTYEGIQDPFVRAIYLKLNLCYLQYFVDVNKRTARMSQTLSLVSDRIMPLLYGYTKETGYIDSIVKYYETGDYRPYIDWFISQYSAMVDLMDPPSLPIRKSDNFV